MQFKADGASRADIYKYVRYIKKVFELEDRLYFPVVEFAENILPQVFDDYVFEVVPENEMGNKHGETIPSKHTIRIREDVYYGAVAGKGRDRFTIAHEIGHFFMHDDNSISLCRLEKGQKLKPYEDPEWQANCFGGELLASSYLIKDMDETTISRICGVSHDAATIQLKHALELGGDVN